MSALAPTLQAFFTDRLASQRHASQHTIAAYRDTMRLLLAFASARSAKSPSELDVGDLDAPLIGAFLDHLEQERGNGPRTRNARRAAIRSLFRYAALKHPEHAATIQRVLSIPPKRFERALRRGFCFARERHEGPGARNHGGGALRPGRLAPSWGSGGGARCRSGCRPGVGPARPRARAISGGRRRGGRRSLRALGGGRPRWRAGRASSARCGRGLRRCGR